MSSEFIKMVSVLTERRLLRTMQSLAVNKPPCGIFFAPAMPDNARQIVDNFKNSGINLNCVCVLSNEYKKFFQPVEGENLVAVEEFPSLPVKPKFIFALEESSFANIFMDYFKRFGVDMITNLNVNGSEYIYNFYMKHLPELYEVHEMLDDDESKKVFRASIIGKVTNILQDFRFAPEPQYFLNGFFPTEGDVAIDGGAYDGETSADFARQGAKVYAFEMDAKNYQNCLARAKKENTVEGGYCFTIENLGLSNQESESFYSSADTGSRKDSNGALTAKFIDLDTYVLRKNLPRVDYIKLDIEGAELDMLHGAAKTITRYKPKMAISAYHKPEDLWTLATYIKSLRGDYEFKFRHYRIDRTNYNPFSDEKRAILRHFGLSYFCPTECEMVLYCK